MTGEGNALLVTPGLLLLLRFEGDGEAAELANGFAKPMVAEAAGEGLLLLPIAILFRISS